MTLEDYLNYGNFILLLMFISFVVFFSVMWVLALKGKFDSNDIKALQNNAGVEGKNC